MSQRGSGCSGRKWRSDASANLQDGDVVWSERRQSPELEDVAIVRLQASPITGEITKETVNHCAGNAVFSGVTVVDATLVLAILLIRNSEACGCIERLTPFPGPLTGGFKAIFARVAPAGRIGGDNAHCTSTFFRSCQRAARGVVRADPGHAS